MIFDIDTTIVFQKNWAAMHAVDEYGVRLYKYIVNKGSSRSSKTYSLIDCCDLYARGNNNKRITVWRDTKKDAVDTVFDDLKKRLIATNRWMFQHTFHATTHVLTYGNSYYKGSTIEIRGADEISAHGLNQQVAWLNEPYLISKTTFDQIDQRTEDFIFIDWNPKQAHWVEDLTRDPRCLVIDSTFQDNPFCPPEQRYKILSYQPVEACRLVKEKLLNTQEARDYDLVNNPAEYEPIDLKELLRCRENEAKKSADLFNWQVYGLGEKSERPHRIFHWKEISVEDYLKIDRPRYYYSDWGAVDPWAVGEVKYMDGALYVRELNYKSENEIRRDLHDTEKMQIGGIDEGLVTWGFSRFGIPQEGTILCDPNRTAKILAVRGAGWDYAVAAPKPPGSIIDGIDLLNNITVYYTSDSVNLKYEQENYSRKLDPYGTVLEEPEDLNNHHMDGCRYVGLWLQYEGIIQKV